MRSHEGRGGSDHDGTRSNGRVDAPVTHQEHGRSVYCCYSIYESTPESTPDGGWMALAVNESKYLQEELQGDNYVGEETK